MYVRLPVFSSLSFHSLSYQWKGGKTRLVFVSSFKNVSIAAGETEKLVRFSGVLSSRQQLLLAWSQQFYVSDSTMVYQ